MESNSLLGGPRAKGSVAVRSACNATADPGHSSLCAIDFSSGWTSYTGGEPGYGTTIQLLRQAIGGAEARRWDADYETPYFDIAGDKIAQLHDSPTQPQSAGCNRCTCEYQNISDISLSPRCRSDAERRCNRLCRRPEQEPQAPHMNNSDAFSICLLSVSLTQKNHYFRLRRPCLPRHQV